MVVVGLVLAACVAVTVRALVRAERERREDDRRRDWDRERGDSARRGGW